MTTETLYFPSDAPLARFVVTVTEKAEHYVKLDARRVTAWEADSDAVADTEPYLSASVKWDGGSHVEFDSGGDVGGYMHLCGVSAWRDHCQMMEWLFKTACAMIPALDESERWV